MKTTDDINDILMDTGRGFAVVLDVSMVRWTSITGFHFNKWGLDHGTPVYTLTIRGDFGSYTCESWCVADCGKVSDDLINKLNEHYDIH